MCTGLEAAAVASLIASAAGTGMSIKANKDKTSAMNAAALNEVANKAKVNRDSQTLFNTTMTGSNPTAAGAAADAAAQEQYAASKAQVDQANIGFGGGKQDLTQSASPVVKEGAARSLADALQVADSQIKARSVMQGLGMQRQQRLQQLTRAGQAAGVLGNFNQEWGRVGQVGQAAAQGAGAQDAIFGDLLTGLGQVGTAYVGTQKPTPKEPVISADPYMSTWGQTGSDLWQAPPAVH